MLFYKRMIHFHPPSHRIPKTTQRSIQNIMLINTAFLGSFLLYVLPSFSHAFEPYPNNNNNTINWHKCEQLSVLPMSCGTLLVPLDYENSTSEQMLELQLVKIDATIQPKKGSLFYNPGGPGAVVRKRLAGVTSMDLLHLTGGIYDIIGFDTRGTGNTLPFLCSDKTIDKLMISKPDESRNTTVGNLWNAVSLEIQVCYQRTAEIGRFIGTGYVARDMMQIVDSLKEDGLLRYWGVSYGTVLGATVAAMFPERMDRVVLDGVVNPHEWYKGVEPEELTDTDATFRGFCRHCAANPQSCILAQHGKSEDELSDKIFDLIWKYKHDPPEDYTSIKLKAEIFLDMYSVYSWPDLSKELDRLLKLDMGSSRKGEPILDIEAKPSFPDTGDDAIAGIKCSDATFRINDSTQIAPFVEEYKRKSLLCGDISTRDFIVCLQWPFKANGAYIGNFHVKTKNPLLFIGNTYDPITPLISAKNASSGFEGSVVLEYHAYGHSSFTQLSICTARALRSYFVDGTLPTPGTICEPDYLPFAPQYEIINNSTVDFTENIFEGDTSDEDKMLLGAMARLGALQREAYFFRNRFF